MCEIITCFMSLFNFQKFGHPYKAHKYKISRIFFVLLGSHYLPRLPGISLSDLQLHCDCGGAGGSGRGVGGSGRGGDGGENYCPY